MDMSDCDRQPCEAEGGHVLVVRLIVLVPLVTGVYTVEVPGLPWPVLVFPIVRRGIDDVLLKIEELFFLVQVFLRFSPVQGLGSNVGTTRRLKVLSFSGRLLWCFGYEPRRSDRTTLFKLRRGFRRRNEEQICVTYQCTLVIGLENNVDLALFVGQLCDVDQNWAHRATVWFALFLRYRLVDHLDDWSADLALGCIVRYAVQQLFLCLQSLVALTFAKLFQAISDHNFMETLQSRLFGASDG